MKLNLNHALLPLLAVFFTALVATGGLYSISDDEDSSQLTGAVSGYQIFQRPSAKPVSKVCAQVITYACENRNPNNCRDFPNACLPPGWSKKQKKAVLPAPDPINTVLPVPEPTKTPILGSPRQNPRMCLLKVVRACAPGKNTDKFGCRPCSRNVMR